MYRKIGDTEGRHQIHRYQKDVEFLGRIEGINVPTKEQVGTNPHRAAEIIGKGLAELVEEVRNYYGSHLKGRQFSLEKENIPHAVQSTVHIVHQARKNVQDMRDHYGPRLDDFIGADSKKHEEHLYQLAYEGMPENIVDDYIVLADQLLENKAPDLAKRHKVAQKKRFRESVQKGKKQREKDEIAAEKAKQGQLF